ncbi:DUF2971 domain-containing protein [Rhodobacteraceae bacterium M385]|nr:DUF2971 domain-containing protein [Rhodobacteraceae bacterium M385]
MKIYKYFSSDVMDLVFQRDDYCGVKCSLPKDYNDPYELFLGVDLDVTTESLATYQDIVQELPQFPTTCFSKSPNVAPMWAHYAQNHSGFVLEFDASTLQETFEEIEICDVDYKAGPNPSLASSLERVAATKKPRHAVWLRQQVLTEAYFSKYQDWSYEQECRLVDRNQYVEDVAGNDILFIPTDCVTAMIVGSKIPEDKKAISIELCQENDIDWYQLSIGKSLALPYMRSTGESVFIFEKGEVTEALGICESCSEPIPSGGDLCVWCSITESHADDAARGNPFRILDHYGQLESYFEGVRNIERKRR